MIKKLYICKNINIMIYLITILGFLMYITAGMLWLNKFTKTRIIDNAIQSIIIILLWPVSIVLCAK